MEKISLEEFIAEIETSMSIYADSNDIDYQSIKTNVLQCLRKFGKNICERNESLIKVVNKKALLPETFKSLTMAVKVDTVNCVEDVDKILVQEKKYIQNPAIWDSVIQDYIVDYCDTKITTEKTYTVSEKKSTYLLEILSLEDHINKNVLDVDCINIHPFVRNKSKNIIYIANRNLTTNFDSGLVYIKFNSFPEIDGEIAIPIITTGAIYEYIKNYVKYSLAEDLISKNKASQGLSQLYSTWKQEERLKFIEAKSEAAGKGLSSNWGRKIYKQNLINRRRLGI